MTDIVVRLRRYHSGNYGEDIEILGEAADEIERLRNLHKTAFDLDMDAALREIERLKAALQEAQEEYFPHKDAEIERLRAAYHNAESNVLVLSGEVERLKAAQKLSHCALRQVISSLEILGQDGWSEAPYLLRECRAALAQREGKP